MSELAQPTTNYAVLEREPPELLGRNLRVASRIWSSATLFFFFAFLFAYFYLRSLNEHGQWKPKGVTPPVTLGTLGTAAIVAAAVLLLLGLADHRAERRDAWRLKGALAVGLLLAALVLQIVAWSSLGFGPTDGGYASVYLGWTALQLLFVVGLAFWVETNLATSLRYRASAPAPGDASGDPGRSAHDIANPLSLLGAEVEALSFYAAVFAGIALVAWIVLYLL